MKNSRISRFGYRQSFVLLEKENSMNGWLEELQTCKTRKTTAEKYEAQPTASDTEVIAWYKHSCHEMVLDILELLLRLIVIAKHLTKTLATFFEARVFLNIRSFGLGDVPFQIPIDGHAPNQATLEREDCFCLMPQASTRI